MVYIGKDVSPKLKRMNTPCPKCNSLETWCYTKSVKLIGGNLKCYQEKEYYYCSSCKSMF